MELFDLVAKLTLDAKEYEQALTEAESKGAGIDDIEAELDLDTSPFKEAVKDAEGTDVADPESPELGLEKDPFDKVVEGAEGEEISDPEAPDLGLDPEQFDKEVEEAENVDIADPEEPKLGLDSQPLKDELSEVEEQDLPTFEQSVGQTLEGIKGLIAGAGIAAAITSVVSSLSEAVDLARSMGDNIDKSSRAMSISATAYQEWSHMLDINGASITDLNRGLMSMRKLMGGGEVTKDAAAAFESLGLSAKVANGEITNTEDLMMATLKALADFEGDAAERDVLAQAIFGRGGTKLNALFDGTSKDMDELIQQAHELGLVMTDEEVANAASYNDAVTNMNASLTALKTSLVSEILPVLTDVFNNAAKIFALFNWRTGDNGLEETFKDIDEKGADALVTLNENKVEAMSLIDKLAQMGDYWTLDDSGKKTFDKLAQELITLFPQLDTVINNNKNAIHNNTEEIKNNIEEWTKLEQQRILSDNLAEKRTAIAKQYAEALDKEVEADIKDSEALGKKETAYAALEKYFNEGRGKAYGDIFKSKYGYEGKMTDEMYNLIGGGFIETLLSEGGYKDADTSKALNEWKDLEEEAASLREEAANLNAEADEAMTSYTKYAETLAERLGITISDEEKATEGAEALNDAIDSIPDEKHVTLSVDGMDVDGSHVKGAWSIPYDNYHAILHRGERILTASEARRTDSSGYGSEAVVGAILSLRNDLQQLQLVVNGKTFGRAVVDYGGNRVDNYLGSADSKLYSGYGT